MDLPVVVEPLGPHHDRAAFSCGVATLDRYLTTQATQDMRRSIAAVFVPAEQGNSAIAGYYTLSATALEPASLPADMARRLPTYDMLPATLIRRLAVDLRYRGQKLGGVLLADALKRGYHNRTTFAAMAIVVDALDEAACTFYAHHGFTRFADTPSRLYLPMTIIKTLLNL